jgi:hypothetical protein
VKTPDRERTQAPGRARARPEDASHVRLPPEVAALAAAGNAALARLLQRDATAAAQAKKPAEQRIVIQVDGEWVEVESYADVARAEGIVRLLKNNYGVSLSSLRSVKAVKKAYSHAPGEVLRDVRAEAWTTKELLALWRAFSHFAPILGQRRASSTRKGAAQEVTSVGKVSHGIDEDSSLGEADDTLGQFFERAKAVAMYAAATDDDRTFPGDNAKSLEGTATHEIAHGLMAYALPDYVKALDFWVDEDTRSFKEGVEAPITKYGAVNADEDLAEAVMMYFVEPKTLREGKGKPDGEPGNPCPKRFDLIEGFVKKWKPGPGSAPTPGRS